MTPAPATEPTPAPAGPALALPAPPAPPPPTAADAPAPAARGVQPGLLLAWAAATVAITMAALLWQKVSGMQQQLARQSADALTRSAEAGALARQASEQVQDANARAIELHTRLAELTGFRAQLESLAQSAARARDENLAVELESTLRMAQEQALLTGSAQPLLAALRTVERRVLRAGDPRLLPVRQAVALDLDRVRDAAVVDTAGLLVRIDQLLRQVDTLPALHDVGVAPPPAPAASAPAAPPDDGAQSRWAQWWQDARQALYAQTRELVRVSRTDHPDTGLATSEQMVFVRERLRLRLLAARLALLARQHEAARADLSDAAALLTRWFDPAARATQAAALLLQDIQAQIRSAELPRVDDTLVALGQVIAALAVADAPAAAPATPAAAPAAQEH